MGTSPLSGSNPKIWSSRIVLIVTEPVPSDPTSRSDWYQASPKFVKPGTGVPFERWLLRWTVNRSKSRLGLKFFTLTVSVSFSLPRVTVTLAVGVLPGAARHGSTAVFGNIENVVEWTFARLAPAASAAGTASAATATRPTARLRRESRLGSRMDITSPPDSETRTRATAGTSAPLGAGDPGPCRSPARRLYAPGTADSSGDHHQRYSMMRQSVSTSAVVEAEMKQSRSALPVSPRATGAWPPATRTITTSDTLSNA